MEEKKRHQKLIETLAIALKLETEGKALFLQAASDTKSKLAKQTFEFLANEEDKHIENIKLFYDTLVDADMEQLPDLEDSKADEKLESFNLMLESLREGFEPSSTDVEAYKIALKFENGAETFYADQLEGAVDPKIIKFYKWLEAEETMHSRLINSCLKFVEDPTEWFVKRNKS